MKDKRLIKDLIYEQLAQIGKAVANPKRLELIELLCQTEKTVETLAREADISVKLASAHLKALRLAQLVETERRGKYIFYRLASSAVSDFWVSLHTLAEERLVGLQVIVQQLAERAHELVPSDRATLLKQARKGDIVVLDVRPADEYLTAHLPFARSIPVDELRERLSELPRDREIVAYCRGPYCLMAKDAVGVLKKHGFRARYLRDGVAEWEARERGTVKSGLE